MFLNALVIATNLFTPIPITKPQADMRRIEFKEKYSEVIAYPKDTSLDFFYLELTTFPTRIKEATVGAAIGYRVSQGNKDGTDFSFHIMKNLSRDLIYCAKMNHLYYLVDKKSNVTPYLGFGFIFGLGAPKGDAEYINSHFFDSRDKDKEYTTFMNGEILLGCEFILNSHRQFLELTYYAGSSTLQLSMGIGL